jgi:hypothetical protein
MMSLRRVMYSSMEISPLLYCWSSSASLRARKPCGADGGGGVEGAAPCCGWGLLRPGRVGIEFRAVLVGDLSLITLSLITLTLVARAHGSRLARASVGVLGVRELGVRVRLPRVWLVQRGKLLLASARGKAKAAAEVILLGEAVPRLVVRPALVGTRELVRILSGEILALVPPLDGPPVHAHSHGDQERQNNDPEKHVVHGAGPLMSVNPA